MSTGVMDGNLSLVIAATGTHQSSNTCHWDFSYQSQPIDCLENLPLRSKDLGETRQSSVCLKNCSACFEMFALDPKCYLP